MIKKYKVIFSLIIHIYINLLVHLMGGGGTTWKRGAGGDYTIVRGFGGLAPQILILGPAP